MSAADRRCDPGERGSSMVEVLVVLVLLGVVAMLFLGGMTSMQGVVAGAADRSARNDEGRLALQQIDREIRSGNVFYDPALESDPLTDVVPSMSLRVYTQSNATTRTPGSRCAQWRVSADRLQTREWAPNDFAATVSAWRTVASGIVNRTVVPAVPAFAKTAPAGFGALVTVTLVVATNERGHPILLVDSVTGRNTQGNYSSNVCDLP
jgi:type II secretory pathway pseudopilin PulG